MEGIHEDTQQDTSSDSADICNDIKSGEETDETSDMTEYTADCCSLTHDKPNQPTDKYVLVIVMHRYQYKHRYRPYFSGIGMATYNRY